ncbi:hypothetical protein Tco_1095781, partial [Tanacetum coccineum]
MQSCVESKEVKPSVQNTIKTLRATNEKNKGGHMKLKEDGLYDGGELGLRSVQLNAGRPNINSVRPNINTGRTNVNSVRPRVNTGSSNEIEALLLRPQQVIIGGTLDQTPIVIDPPLKNMEDRGIFDSGCSRHMTGNKDHLDDFEECKGGSVTFGENQTNQHAGTSEVTNPNAGTSKVTTSAEDSPKILAFRRELDELAQKHLREVPKKKATNMPELTIFNKPQKGIFDEASYDEEGMVHDFNNLPTEVVVSPIPTLRIHNIHPQSQILGDPKSSVQTRSRVKQTSGAHALVVKALFGLHQATKAWYAYSINISRGAWTTEGVKTAITPMETKMALTKDEEADDVDVHLYRSMI